MVTFGAWLTPVTLEPGCWRIVTRSASVRTETEIQMAHRVRTPSGGQCASMWPSPDWFTTARAKRHRQGENRRQDGALDQEIGRAHV